MNRTVTRILALSLAAISFSSTAFGFASKTLSDYKKITPTRTSSPADLRVHYFAKQKVNDRAHDPLYKNNQWKLVMRRGKFLAEKDKAMSEMYRYFLGYSTDVDIVEDNGDTYIARRKFTSFKKAFNPNREIHDYLRKVGDQYYVGKYQLQDNGRLLKDGDVKQFKGLASIAVLTEFFGEADFGDYNYGYQISDRDIKAIFYDCEHALNFHEDDDGETYTNMEDDLKEANGEEFLRMSWYVREKQQMLEKIANTDFSVIERILRNNITGSQLDEARYVLNKVLSDPTVLPSYDRAEARRQLDEVNKLDDKDYNINPIIETLRKRHAELRARLKNNNA